MAALSDALLPLDMDTRQGSALRSTAKATIAALAFSAVLLSSTLLFYVGVEFGRVTPHDHAVFAVTLPGNGSLVGLPTALAAGLNPDCYTFTGGTCHVEKCADFRNADCEEGYCLCTGSCTGVDGVCYPETYPVVASGFTLTNKKYYLQKMYMPTTGLLDQLKTTASPSAFNLGKDKFILHALPGLVAGHQDFFLTTERFPDYVAAIRATAGTAVSTFGAYEVGLYKEYSPDALAVRVCSKGDGQVMIGSPGAVSTEWFYAHHGSWCVYGWGISDPGDGGVWVTDPAIPDGVLPACE